MRRVVLLENHPKGLLRALVKSNIFVKKDRVPTQFEGVWWEMISDGILIVAQYRWNS